MPLLGPLFRAARGAVLGRACRGPMVENRPGDTVLGRRHDGGAAGARQQPGDAQPGGELRRLRTGARRSAGKRRRRASTAASDRLRSQDPQPAASISSGSNPNCPVCGPARERAGQFSSAASRPLVLASRPVLPQVDGGWRSVPTAAGDAAASSATSSPLTGIICRPRTTCSPRRRPAGLPGAAGQTHAGRSRAHNRLLGQPGGAAGKGMSEAQAQVSCLAEAMERYLCGHTGHEPRRRARWAELGERAPAPRDLPQLQRRPVRQPRGLERASPWLQLGGGTVRRQPRDRLDAGMVADATARAAGCRRAIATSTTPMAWPGRIVRTCSASPIPTAARRAARSRKRSCRACFEIVERDACALWWYNRVRRPRRVADRRRLPVSGVSVAIGSVVKAIPGIGSLVGILWSGRRRRLDLGGRQGLRLALRAGRHARQLRRRGGAPALPARIRGGPRPRQAGATDAAA